MSSNCLSAASSWLFLAGSVGDGYLSVPGAADPVDKRGHPAGSMERSGLLPDTWLEQTFNHYSEWQLNQLFWTLRYCTIHVGCCVPLPLLHIFPAICQVWYGWMKIFTDKSLHLCFFRFGLMQLRRSSSLWVQVLVFSWPLPATILFITTATSTPGSHLYCCHFLLSALRFCYHKLELKMWTLFTLYS